MHVFDPKMSEGFWVKGLDSPQGVGHAPEGGRRVTDGPVEAEAFCFVYGQTLVISDPPCRGPSELHSLHVVGLIDWAQDELVPLSVQWVRLTDAGRLVAEALA